MCFKSSVDLVGSASDLWLNAVNLFTSPLFSFSLFFLSPIELLIFAGSSAAVALSLSFFYYISRV